MYTSAVSDIRREARAKSLIGPTAAISHAGERDIINRYFDIMRQSMIECGDGYWVKRSTLKGGDTLPIDFEKLLGVYRHGRRVLRDNNKGGGGYYIENNVFYSQYACEIQYVRRAVTLTFPADPVRMNIKHDFSRMKRNVRPEVEDSFISDNKRAVAINDYDVLLEDNSVLNIKSGSVTKVDNVTIGARQLGYLMLCGTITNIRGGGVTITESPTAVLATFNDHFSYGVLNSLTGMNLRIKIVDVNDRIPDGAPTIILDRTDLQGKYFMCHLPPGGGEYVLGGGQMFHIYAEDRYELPETEITSSHMSCNSVDGFCCLFMTRLSLGFYVYYSYKIIPEWDLDHIIGWKAILPSEDFIFLGRVSPQTFHQIDGDSVFLGLNSASAINPIIIDHRGSWNFSFNLDGVTDFYRVKDDYGKVSSIELNIYDGWVWNWGTKETDSKPITLPRNILISNGFAIDLRLKRIKKLFDSDQCTADPDYIDNNGDEGWSDIDYDGDIIDFYCGVLSGYGVLTMGLNNTIGVYGWEPDTMLDFPAGAMYDYLRTALAFEFCGMVQEEPKVRNILKEEMALLMSNVRRSIMSNIEPRAIDFVNDFQFGF